MKINTNLASKKQHRKQRENIGSRTLHGSILEGLGRLLGAIGALLGAMIAFLGRSWALLGRLFGLMGASGLIWGGFGRLLGGSWEVLGRILKKFWEDVGRISSFQRPPRCLANSLGVTMRGGPSPSVVEPGLLRSLGRRPYRVGFARPAEGHRGPSTFFILGAKLAPSSHFFAICLHFFRTMFRSRVFYRSTMVLAWLLGGLGRIPGVFWK